MRKAVFVLGSMERNALQFGKPLLASTLSLLDDLATTSDLEVDLVFATQDPFLAGRSKSDIKIAGTRRERPRVLDEIAAAKPELVVCFGPVAAMSVFDRGNITEDDLLWQEHFPLGEHLPVYYTFSLENIRYAPGLKQWLYLDLKAIVEGNLGTTWGDYVVITPDQFAESNDFADKPSAMEIAMDLETYPGLDFYHPEARIRMAQLCVDAERGSVVLQSNAKSEFPRWFKAWMENPNIKKVGSNIKYDVKWLRRFGINTRNFECTSTREHLIDSSNPRTDLKFLTRKYRPKLGNYAKPHLELVKQRGGWEHVTDEEQYAYAAADAEASIATYQGQVEALIPLERPRELINEVYPILADMEFQGACIDPAMNMWLDASYKKEMDRLRREIAANLGPINPNSPKQLAEALLEHVPGIDLSVRQLSRVLSDDAEQEYSTHKDILTRESPKHPVIDTVLRFRRYRSRHSTFIEKVRDRHMMHHHGGYYIHPNFRTDRVETYRLSSSEPNTQNIPRNDTDDPELSVKRQFISRWPEGSILEADMSQIEIRFAAWASQDKTMLEALASGQDIHRSMASEFLGKPFEAVLDNERTECKEITFGVQYGGGAKLLQQKLQPRQISKDEARAMIAKYFGTFRGLKRYIDKVHKQVLRDLYVETHFGFRRTFGAPETEAEKWSIQRQGFNAIIQNGAACLTYCAMIALHKALAECKLQSKMILQVHDSIVLDVHPDEVKQVQELTLWAMQEGAKQVATRYGIDFAIPLVADIKIGPNWGDAKQPKPSEESDGNS